MEPPRSPFDQVGGMVYFARMLDKIRLSASGRLRHDFRKNIGIGFDGRCTRYLHVVLLAARRSRYRACVSLRTHISL
jgi:hypothetical protein